MPERQSKATQGRHERMLLELLKLPGNDRCADCNSRNPRWASYSLGIFLCIRCAGLHRKMGTHVSRVKSITMDEWSLEQIDMMRKGGGNDKVNLTVNPHPDRNTIPVGDDEGDRALERFIRNKWEKRAFVTKPVIAPPPVPSPKIPAPAQNYPKRSSSVPVVIRDQEEYSASMGKLFEMGFRDTERNRQVLRHTKGNVSAAVDILSRLPNAQRSIINSNTNNNQPITLEDKLLRLNVLGFTNVAANQDALRRSGGNYEVAISILEGQKKQQQQQRASEILPAFSNSSSSSDNKLAGRAQNVLERQTHTLSGGKTGILLDLESTTTTAATAAATATNINPFHISSQPTEQQQQQQQQPSFFSQPTTNPFGQTSSPGMTVSSSTPSIVFNTFSQSQQQASPAFSNVPLQPQLTGMPSPAQNTFMQPQMTGMPLSGVGGAVQPQVTGMPVANNNPFSQMTSASPSITKSQSFSERHQMPQRANTAPDFLMFLQQQQSPFTTAAPLAHQQIPQQQQQQHPSLVTSAGFTSMVSSQPNTGFIPTATTGANANNWTSTFF
ncbi:hypothetical protein BX666DRAFT_1965134 [Dichotomocladium elegans]|nr:hypothetical protein BX666DRAFT_1965134 [Dichotomocladium elegans]